MKILHIGLPCYFTEGMLYQDNILTDINCKDGHEVIYITNTEKYVDGNLVDVGEEDKKLSNGLRLIRLKNDKIINKFVTNKILKCRKLINYLYDIQPDTILYHGCYGYELMDVADYVKRKPKTLFYVDIHQDFNNSSKSFFSMIINKCVHGYFVKRARPYVKKFLSISLESTHYVEKMFKIPNEMIEDFPLGGIISSKDEQQKNKRIIVEKYGIKNDSIILGHSGKLVREKKTIELIKAINRVKDDRFRLIIFGAVPDEDEELKNIINNESKVIFVGWKNGEEQRELLCAIDLYCQPGSQSATAEMAICNGCALMLARHLSYEYLYGNNVMYAETVDEIEKVLKDVSKDISVLEKMKKKGMKIAMKKLDYRVLANRYLY